MTATINHSMSDKKEHFSNDEIRELFFKDDFSKRDLYALDKIFGNTFLQEIVNFMQSQEIPFTQGRKMLQKYKETKYNSIHNKYVWLFSE